jgi:hypothetical protein
MHPIPARAGIGLRLPHQAMVLAERPQAAWLEVHPENYMSDAHSLAELERIRADYPLSLHAVGLSLGSAQGVDVAHIERLRRLVQRLEPALVSDHLSWSIAAGQYLPDLLPLPYTDEALQVVCRNVTQVQEALGRQLLVENPSTYLQFSASAMPEAEFLAAVRPPHGLRRAVRCQQYLRQRNQPKAGCGASDERLVPRARRAQCRGDSPCRACRHDDGVGRGAAHRRPRRSCVRSRVGTV